MTVTSILSARPAALIPLTGVTAVHLGAQLVAAKPVMALTQVLLMPMLALWVFLATRTPRSRTTRLALLALGLSWLGDAVPRVVSKDAAFLVMLGFFLLAQLTFCAALMPHLARSVLGGRPALVPGLLGGAVILLVVALVALGPLAGAVVCYASAIIAMALLATSLGRPGLLGGTLFIVSDTLIALHTFAGIRLPAGGFWIMSTYVAAELLLAVGVVHLAARGSAPDVADAPGARRPERRWITAAPRSRGAASTAGKHRQRSAAVAPNRRARLCGRRAGRGGRTRSQGHGACIVMEGGASGGDTATTGARPDGRSRRLTLGGA